MRPHRSPTRPHRTDDPVRRMHVTHDGGQSWISVQLPSQLSSLDRIMCVSTQYCLALGAGPESNTSSVGSGHIIGTLDGGLEWTSQTLPDGRTDLYPMSIACISAIRCFIAAHSGGGGASILSTSSSGSRQTTSPSRHRRPCQRRRQRRLPRPSRLFRRSIRHRTEGVGTPRRSNRRRFNSQVTPRTSSPGSVGFAGTPKERWAATVEVLTQLRGRGRNRDADDCGAE
jgi:hypothetical protein